MNAVEILTNEPFCKLKGEARKLIAMGSVIINGKVVSIDDEFSDFISSISVGKSIRVDNLKLGNLPR